jgi:hypothetical protein
VTKHRVLVWGSGFVGKLVIRELLDHPRFALAGVLVHDEEKHGVDVGELVGVAPTGMRATRDVDAALALPADAVAYFGPTAMYLQDNLANMSRALRANARSTRSRPCSHRRHACSPRSICRSCRARAPYAAKMQRMKKSLTLVLFTSLAGCGGFFTTAAAARAQFVEDVTCPANRVTVVHAPASTPPPDIAADPGRLALWSSQAKQSPTYVTTGCGQERRYFCTAYGNYPYQYNCVRVAP